MATTLNRSFSELKRMLIAIALLLSFSLQSQSLTPVTDSKPVDFKISLAQWSLHRAFNTGSLNPTDFPEIATSYGIYSIELVNSFYKTKANDMAYWKTFKQKCEDANVNVGLIMCDGLGHLGDADAQKRQKTVENHFAWVDIAKYLGAHSIRVNAAGKGNSDEVALYVIDGLTKLGKYGASKGINIIVENHGGYSSNGAWLANVMENVNMENVGTLPDFGNFCMTRATNRNCLDEYDRYKGMTELMPFAKGVSAKSHDFDATGKETKSDFFKMMAIVKASGYKGYIGIEYEGRELSEDEGIKATKALLENVLAKL
ncbi:sugar phosphate isomerase/epimerase family protein [Formosa sp. 3Alg 14/1]|uniref:sugar phosphate isomerase/epimerase family protein n=1 Tax=Formosa sp. 3Alg 14/1 TaxID=3382190 RepID=UPI0039BDDDF5